MKSTDKVKAAQNDCGYVLVHTFLVVVILYIWNDIFDIETRAFLFGTIMFGAILALAQIIAIVKMRSVLKTETRSENINYRLFSEIVYRITIFTFGLTTTYTLYLLTKWYGVNVLGA